ncbi:BAG family molecular chaperone regulator 8, chloroplastic [Olea europaea var. sylvestris]|uniref:BAG family molecular chaperone regulator 8, chloroplastic n=1 Tax=Olea europaea var. sylvestris TaxID=158386 RepID=UPI000C1D45BD|nr:BAG family molecular chaperone regulator 8, chloroplastic [Olea europaea var. sylvestris]
MASRQPFCKPTAAVATCSCHCCYTTYSTCHGHPLPPPAMELHLHTTPSHILHTPTHIDPPYTTSPHLPNPPQHYPLRYFQEPRHTQIDPTVSVSSLLGRISALESALRRRPPSSSQSLREAAASIIQSHFRVFLARRSRTLWQLKDLASIKSTLSILKSSVSGNTHYDCEALSHKLMALLLKLDSIKGGDPMIRDGKRSLSRELVNFLEFIEGLKRRELSSRLVKNVRNGESRVFQCKRIMGNVNVEKLKGLVERIEKLSEYDEEGVELTENSGSGDISMIRNRCVSQNRNGGLMKRGDRVQSKGRKSVTFAENGNVYRVYRSSGKPCLNGDCDVSINDDDSIDDERELLDDLCREVEEIGVSSKEAEDDEEEKDLLGNGSDGKNELRNYPESESKHIEIGGFVFSAPLPVKMETRGDLLENRKTVKFAK